MSGKTPRPLTNDERKAAEAAFRGLPFNDDWSHSAREMYDGIAAFLALRSVESAGQAQPTPDLEPVHS